MSSTHLWSARIGSARHVLSVAPVGFTWVCLSWPRVVSSQARVSGAAASAEAAGPKKPSVPVIRPPPNTAAMWLNSQGKRLRSIGPDMNKELALCVSGKRIPAHRWVRAVWCLCVLLLLLCR